MKKFKLDWHFNPVHSGMLSGLCCLPVFWTIGYALPVVTFALAIAMGICHNLNIEKGDEEKEGMKNMVNAANGLFTLMFLIICSFLPPLNTISIIVDSYLFWPKATLGGFIAGIIFYIAIRMIKMLFTLAKRAGDNNLVVA